jgi:hypothetical protein
VVSTTSVDPSHRPRAAPMYIRIAGANSVSRGAALSIGMMRVS